MPKGYYERPTLEERLEKWTMPEPISGCHIWIGTRGRNEYGLIGIWDPIAWKQITRPVHRVAYELAYGPIPEGMLVCHVCDTPPCLRPSHLFLGTPAENLADMDRKGRRRPVKGEQHGLARYSRALILEIRAALASGLLQREIAAKFGVAQSHVSRIKMGQTWRHLLNG